MVSRRLWGESMKLAWCSLPALLSIPGLIACAACSACVGILFILLRTGLAWDLAPDIPNHRSLHARPTPRIGGWGIVPVAIIALVLLSPSLAWAASGALVLAVVSYLDDRYN